MACVVLTTGCVSVNSSANKWTVESRVDIQTRLGLSYMKLGRLEPASLALGRALALAPNNSKANHAMALFQLRLSDRAAAEPIGSGNRRCSQAPGGASTNPIEQ